uniref:Retrovirus-related Pol polyprotein from transposon TNT 1-94-like beta-barrel domain-containing protein n=1 Tax=Tanacetum cinerariifolium TaxID=118510 RepID=A0A6L2LIU1_TANCI|nr:hypothetical protein [Tanacetum cinerariifolium]
MPTCDCRKIKECTCDVLEKFMLRDNNSKLIQFLMKLNDDQCCKTRPTRRINRRLDATRPPTLPINVTGSNKQVNRGQQRSTMVNGGQTCQKHSNPAGIWSQILSLDPLPTTNKAYYIIQQIKKQKQVTSHVFEPTVFFANMNNKNSSGGRKDNIGMRTRLSLRGYTNCGQKGHVFEQCFERLGYPDWYKVRMNQGGNVDSKLVASVCQEMMKLFKGKGIMEDKGSASTSHAGASDHMSPNLSLFISTRTLKTLIIVHLTNGSSKTVTIVSQVRITPSLILTDVFCLPDFQLNLLSVGKLI